MESMVQKMQVSLSVPPSPSSSSSSSLPQSSSSSSLSPLLTRKRKHMNVMLDDVISGLDLINWLARHITDGDVSEASHVTRLLKRFNYIYSLGETGSDYEEDSIASNYYLFQAPYYWPSVQENVDEVDYAIYLVKRILTKDDNDVLSDMEQESLVKLERLLCDRWDFIMAQGQSQIRSTH
ncbi:hypothetical protein HELRODRAFT_159786 [Helobdella robusta]|uniref:DEP domain-containing protein n=1 Tax=Helobdella robusta TaxID=6412 RepID=T1EPE5_HELRO|nr:hypothetical protein HELRODRAFT_159786 [Helobdella robusta]ESO13157.1 hypothetical protein HELRODRAFT_159786 [Helobdella robusta]